MSVNRLTHLESQPFAVITPEELGQLLTEGELLDEVDTHINKMIRIFRHQERLFVQESSFEDELFVRPMDSREEADTFVNARLETYERMWDGCGCKINFRESVRPTHKP